MASHASEAYFTLLTNDAYLPGAMVLAHSLRDNGAKRALGVLITPNSLAPATISELKTCYDYIISVDHLTNQSPANLILMDRPDLASAFTKIGLWKQTQFSKIFYIDADVVALRAPDELFNLRESFSAAPDVGWPDIFNSGVMVLKPNMGDYYALRALAERGISFDGADQGLLNMHFRTWNHLSFTYNCTPSASYQYVPAYRHFQSSISLVHFIGKNKPWMQGKSPLSGRAGDVYEELVTRWWAVYDKHYKSTPSPVHQYVAGESPLSNLGSIDVPLVSSPTDHTTTNRSIPALPPPTSSEWDPRHHPPPTGAQPEAANFPVETYAMSTDAKLFQAPPNPAPPKGLLPDDSEPNDLSGSSKVVFPWEGKGHKPSRIFAEDSITPTTAAETISVSAGTSSPAPKSDSVGTRGDANNPYPMAAPVSVNLHSPIADSFASYRSNAWDEMPEINRYVASLPQNRRARANFSLSVRSSPRSLSTSHVHFSSADPTANLPATELSSSGDHSSVPIRKNNTTRAVTFSTIPTPLAPASSQQRVLPNRPSLKLTDFPTEFERPSLPVTPAPIHRSPFWSLDADGNNEPSALPSAEGVPEASQWDPLVKLHELQQKQADILARSSDITNDDAGCHAAYRIPTRDVPASSIGP